MKNCFGKLEINIPRSTSKRREAKGKRKALVLMISSYKQKIQPVNQKYREVGRENPFISGARR